MVACPLHHGADLEVHVTNPPYGRDDNDMRYYLLHNADMFCGSGGLVVSDSSLQPTPKVNFLFDDFRVGEQVAASTTTCRHHASIEYTLT